MNTEDLKIKEAADEYARQNKKPIAKRLTDTSLYQPETHPVSVFMAGSPGAGKTESSKWLITQIAGREDAILRIDTDELRKNFDSYTGDNSHLFQGATSILANKMHDCAMDNSQSFIFDGTFSKIEIARKNIARSLDKGRSVSILYVYQDPLQAWDFVKKRALIDGRQVPKDSFIEQYFNAREVVNSIKKEFSPVQVYLLVKNIDGSTQEYRQNVDNIDNYVKEMYTRESLNSMLL